MSNSKVIDYRDVITQNIFTGDAINALPKDLSGKAVVSESPYRLSKINQTEYGIAKIVNRQGNVKISQRLPFYVKFENIGISGYGPSFPAPIGIAVIGLNNYIL
jgi:hypothetical protein